MRNKADEGMPQKEKSLTIYTSHIRVLAGLISMPKSEGRIPERKLTMLEWILKSFDV